MFSPLKCLFGVFLFAALAAANPSQAAVVGKDHPDPLLYTYDLTTAGSYGMDTLAGKNNIWAECHVVAALQGLANRTGPRLYIYFNTDDPKISGHLDKFWLAILQQPGGWLAKKKLQPITNFTALITKFRPAFKGVVLYDLSVSATSHVASTVAGCDDLLPIPYDPTPGSVYDRLVVHGPQLPVKVRLIHTDGTPLFTGAETGSAKCDAYLWAKRHYLDTGKCDPTRLGYYVDAFWIGYPGNVAQYGTNAAQNTELCSADYLIQHKAFFFDLSPWDDEAPNDDPKQPIGTDFKTMSAILLSAYTQTHGKHMVNVVGFIPLGWKYSVNHGGHHGEIDAEWHAAAIFSCYNAFLDSADTAMANASVYSLFPLKTRYPQHKPTIADWKKAGYVDASGKVVPRSYVSFYIGDYDSAAWIYQFLPAIWTDPARGRLALGWAFNPNLAARFPVGLDWTRKTATSNDLFVCGDSAAGYLNVGNLDGDRPYSHLPSGVATWARFNKYWYEKFDLTLSGFVIDGFSKPMSSATAKAYATFSPDGVVAEYAPKQPAFLDGTHVPTIFMEYGFASPADLPYAVSTIKGLLGSDTGAIPYFHDYRTILWKPNELLRLKQGIEQAAPNARVVDPYTFMGLAKLWLQQKGH